MQDNDEHLAKIRLCFECGGEGMVIPYSALSASMAGVTSYTLSKVPCNRCVRGWIIERVTTKELVETILNYLENPLNGKHRQAFIELPVIHAEVLMTK